MNCGDNCAQIELLPIQSDLYSLEATSTTGCVARDSFFVEVSENRELFIPNAFSPNGDGVNDFFMVMGDEPLVQRVVSLQIYDRWGQQVFEKTNISPNVMEEGWNGRGISQELPTGIYVYQVTVEFLDQKVLNYSGDVLLLRE